MFGPRSRPSNLSSIGTSFRSSPAEKKPSRPVRTTAAEDLPHREKYLRLTLDHLHGLLDLHEQLVARAEDELTS